MAIKKTLRNSRDESTFETNKQVHKQTETTQLFREAVENHRGKM